MAIAIINYPLNKKSSVLLMAMIHLEEIILQDGKVKAVVKQCKKVTELAQLLPPADVEYTMKFYDNI